MADETFNLGSATAYIKIDGSDVARGINAAMGAVSRGLGGLGDLLSGFGDKLTGIGARITVLTAPLAAFGKQGLEVAQDFDTLMKQIELFGGVSGDELEKVRGFVLKMGADTVFSASDAGAAMLDLMKSGQTLEQAMKTLPVVLDLATAGNLSLESSAGIVTSTLAQFNLKVEDAGKVSDALARAANASRADVSDLGQALGNVGPIAATYGLSVEQTSAILGVFANNGIKGAEAGTQLKSMLLNMSAPTDRATGAWKKLGVSLYDNKGKMRDLNTVIKDLDGALDKLPVKEQNELMQALGGSYGIVGLNALRASDGIDDMLAKMKEAPSATALAAGQSQTFARSVESLKGSIETLQIQALTPFMNNVLKPLVDRLIPVINSITEWAAKNPELTATIVAIGAALVTLGPLLAALGLAFGAIGTVIGVIIGPVGLVIAGVVALGAAIATNFGGIRDVLTNIWNQIQPHLENMRKWFVETALPAIVTFVQDSVIPAFQKLIGWLQDIWNKAAPSLIALWLWFTQTALPAIRDFVVNQVIPRIGELVNTIKTIWERVAPELQKLFNWFVINAMPIIMVAANIFKGIIESVIKILGGIWEAVGPPLKDLFDWFTKDGFPAVVKIVEDFYKLAIEPLIKLMAGIWDAVGKQLEKFASWINDNIPGIRDFFQGIVDAIKAIPGAIQSVIGGVEEFIKKLQNLLFLQQQTATSGGTGGSGGGGDSEFRDSGGPGRAGAAYLIGQQQQGAEIFVPGDNGTFIPDFVRMIENIVGGSGRGGDNGDSAGKWSFAPGAIVINANSYEGGRRAADGFMERFMELRNRQG